MVFRAFGTGRAFHHAARAAVIVAVMAIGVAAQERSQDKGDRGRDEDRRHDAYAIALWGDLPYSDLQATVGVPNLIADMNHQRLAFSVHDGDLKQGNGSPTCSDALYVDSRARFDALTAPAMFTPGDNDWTDCDRPNNGGFNSLERLTHERAVLFSTPFSLGQHRLRQQVQTDRLCLGVSDPVTLTKVFVPCVENRRWTVGGVTYATLNIQGSCNNLCGDVRTRPSSWHATPPTYGGCVKPSPTRPITIRQRSCSFHKLTRVSARVSSTRRSATQRHWVAYVHGDSHYFRIDKPLLNAQGARLENFTRVETFGDHAENGNNDVHWLKVLVDADTREVFAYQPQIVPANRTAVASPEQ